MKKQNIIFALIISIMTIFFCACGNKIKFTESVKIYNFGQNYSIPCNTKNCNFNSSNTDVIAIENNKIVPISGGYSIITANNEAKMVAIVTGITHTKANLKFTTISSKVYNNDEISTLGVTINIENLDEKEFIINAQNCPTFSIYEPEKNLEYSSYECKLSSNSKNDETITIKGSTSVEIIVYFKITNMDQSIFSKSNGKYFNIEYANLVIGASKISEWVH